MPDDHHPFDRGPDPEQIDLAAIKTDLEFLIERVEQFRREQALKPLYTMIGSAAIVTGDRGFLAALSLSHAWCAAPVWPLCGQADLLEPHGGRLSIRHSFYWHAVISGSLRRVIYRME